ncbi:MAG TPA: TonB-dependent receptor [Candidatus Baltobacteraceae bacterium]|nr:TonB-dependent receptor [Candidatus Baltobacteraceae bacterium]
MYIRRLFGLALLLTLSPLAAYAQGAPSGAIAGSVRTSAGVAVPGALVTADGPTHASVPSDARGDFKLALTPGVYRLTVTKGGYVPASLSDIAVLAGSTQSVEVTMTLADLTSLRTIATVSTSARASSINTGAASSTYLPGTEVSNLANPQINDVIQRIPDVVIQRQGSQPDTTIVLGGVQPYETQVLIDGHPISLGEFGVWLTEYFPSYLLSGVETEVGPGNTTAFASTAVGGTTNLVTPGYTVKPTTNFVIGSDNYNSQYSSLLLTGSFGKFAYVAGAGYGSNNGPFFNQTHCVVSPDNYSSGDNLPGNTGIIQFCGNSSGSLFNKGLIFKLRYSFSPATSFEVGFIGAYGGYLPQGTSYGQYLGMTTIEPCLVNAGYTANSACTNPGYGNLVGKSIPAYAWYPGSNVYYNQPIFTAEFRQSIGNDTLLIRPYAGNIEWILDGADENEFPYFYSLPGACSAANGGTSGTNCANFINACNNESNYDGYFAGNISADGTGECNQSQFSELEQDKLYGSTLSYLHPVGDNLFTFTYDFHGDNSYGYYNANIPQDVTVPETLMHYTTLSLVGDIRVSRTVGVKAGIYDSTWSVDGSQNVTPYATPNPTTYLVPQIPLQRSASRFDPHVALTYQPTGNVSYRAAVGTSETFPFSGYLSGAPFYTPPSATSGTVAPNGFVTFKAPYLNPENATEESLGMDWRAQPNGIFRIDLQNTQVHNVFEELTTPTAISWPYNGTVLTGVSTVQPTNAALLSVQTATLSYTYAPRFGLGYFASMAFERSIVNGIPLVFYGLGPSLPANGQQTCGFGLTIPGSVTCIPYMKGYYQLNYTFKDRSYVGLGADFEGKNNTYFQPPFLQFDLTAKKTITPTLEAQFSVENLLNTNDFYYLPQPNAGVTTTLGQYGPLTAGGPAQYYQTTEPSTLIPTLPRTIRFQLRWHVARP